MKKIILTVTLLLLITLSACKPPVEYSDEIESENSLTSPTVSIVVTGYGTMTFELFPEIAPQTVNNFLTIATSGQYVGSTFHRVIEDFMIQGGKVEGSLCPIYGEFLSNGFDNSLEHERGVISMARTNVRDSATSQFFIMHSYTQSLDGEYAGFGQLTSGFSVLDAIATTNTNDGDQPLTDIVIEEVTVDLDGFVLQDIICAD